MGVHEAQVEDAAQEVFVVAHRKLASFRGESSLRTWLYGIVRNVASNQRRSVRRRGEHTPIETSPPRAAGDPERQLQERQRALFVQRFAESLDDKKRDVFVLALLEGLAIPEVAEILAIPVDTAYTRLRSVRADFQQAIARMKGAL